MVVRLTVGACGTAGEEYGGAEGTCAVLQQHSKDGPIEYPRGRRGGGGGGERRRGRGWAMQAGALPAVRLTMGLCRTAGEEYGGAEGTCAVPQQHDDDGPAGQPRGQLPDSHGCQHHSAARDAGRVHFHLPICSACSACGQSGKPLAFAPSELCITLVNMILPHVCIPCAIHLATRKCCTSHISLQGNVCQHCITVAASNLAPCAAFSNALPTDCLPLFTRRFLA